jgi:hypothetical protein
VACTLVGIDLLAGLAFLFWRRWERARSEPVYGGQPSSHRGVRYEKAELDTQGTRAGLPGQASELDSGLYGAHELDSR